MKWRKLLNLKRFRSLEVALPLVLGLFVWGSLTFIVYGGTKRDRLASQAEKFLIEMSLRSSRKEAQDKTRIQVVSLTEKDLNEFPAAPSPKYKGVDIRVYGDLLRRIASEEPEVIYFSWFPGAHRTNMRYLKPLVDAVKEVKDKTRLYLVYPVAEIGLLPPQLRDLVPVLEGDDCHYDVMSYCTYEPKWSGRWIIQTIADEFWGPSAEDLPRHHVTNVLPHFLPNYLVNLPLAQSLPTVSFAEALKAGPTGAFKGKAVFVGSSVVQPEEHPIDKNVVQRVYTVHDDQSRGLHEAGTPYHVFWAQLAQMFVDGNTVAVPPRWILVTLMIGLCVTMLLILWRLPAPWALAFFIGYALLLPLLNNILVEHTHLYIPTFDMVYAGFLTFLYPAFFLMSFELYKRWQLEALEKSLARTEALKTNFISLISHNLNTPVAKMQGLLDILWQSPELSERKGILSRLRWQVSRLQLCVRAVLISTALQDGNLNESVTSLRNLKEEFANFAQSLMQRLGITYTLEMPGDGDEEAHLPFHADVRAVSVAMASALALIGSARSGFLTFKVHLEEDSRLLEHYRLRFIVHTKPADAKPGGTPASFEDEGLTRSFFETTLARYLTTLSALYGGVAENLDEKGPKGNSVELSFVVRSA